jgi:hypothetical protein
MRKRAMRIWGLTLVLIFFSCGWVQGNVITGQITDWLESGPYITIGDGTNHVTLWWSMGTTNDGWFYGSAHTSDSDVAFASGVSDISQITDASGFSFTSGNIGIYGIGDFLIWENINTGYFGVLRPDIISGTGTHATYLSGTWWFQTNGSGNFSGVAVPEPSTMLLLGAGLIGLIGLRRRLRK